MPYFLVTHKSLIEAADDIGAASNVLAKIRDGGDIGFEVKFDESTVSHVVLTLRELDEIEDALSLPQTEADQNESVVKPEPRHSNQSSAAGKVVQSDHVLRKSGRKTHVAIIIALATGFVLGAAASTIVDLGGRAGDSVAAAMAILH